PCAVNADGDIERLRVTPQLGVSLFQLRAAIRDRLNVADPCRVPRVGILRGEAEHPRARARHEDRRAVRPRASREDLAVRRADILPVEIDLTILEQSTDDLDTFLETGDEVIHRVAERLELRLL